MSREQVFDTEIKKFFDVSIKILEAYNKTFLSLHATPDNHIIRNLQRYRIVYNMTSPEDHIPYFQKLFRNNKSDLGEVLKDDKWLLDGSIVIQYGEDLEDEELRKRAEKRKIEVSAIYKCAVQLRKSVEESLKGLPETAQEQSQELIYPDVFLLHLYRILYAIYPQNKDLQKVVQTLEKELGISSQKKMNPLLEGLAENAKSLFGNLNLGSNQDMSQKLEQAFKDPVVNETLGATVSSLMNAKNLGEGLGAALKSLENPKFMDGILKAVQTFIPPETLDTIMKSTEQLKENGDVKQALGKLGLPEIDISKMLTDGKANGGLDLSKMLNINHLASAVESAQAQAEAVLPEQVQEPSLMQEVVVDEIKVQPTVVGEESVVSESTDTPLPQQLDLGQLAKGLENINPEQMIQSLLKSVPPEFQNLLSQMMKQPGGAGGALESSGPEPSEKSLIDLDI